MIKPDWNIFKAKFSDNPQFNFEWLCYLLFCKEFEQPFGISRYKNQSAIETNPVTRDDEVIGFQSKFYDTKLSDKKDELITTLEKAKRDYPELTKLYLYTNQEWSQSYSKKNSPTKQAKKSKAQTEVEDKAKTLSIKLEWRTASYFESPFVTQECQSTCKYFFVTGKSIVDLIEAQDKHTQAILKNIKQTMRFNNKDISIDRDEIQTSLIEEKSPISIVCGKGGVGKTVEIKKLFLNKRDSQPFFAFKATEFEIADLDDLIGDVAVKEFLTLFDGSQKKVLVIDSAEKLMELSNQEPFKEFIDLAIEKSWRIIFTTRDYYFDDLNHLCIEVLRVNPQKVYIPPMSMDELNNLANENVFLLPEDERLKELLRLPIYLSNYLLYYNEANNQHLNISQFKQYLWKTKITQGVVAREKVFTYIANRRANEGKFFVSLNSSETEVAATLASDEILGIEGSSFFISHDIYEEWALEKVIDLEFKNRSSTKSFFDSIGKALPIRRSFRLWLSEQLHNNENEITPFIDQALCETNLPSIWKDELYTAILLSEYSSTFFKNFRRELLKDDLVILQRLSFILRIACKEIDNSLNKLLGLKLNSQWYVTKPKGHGWHTFINFLFENTDQIGADNLAKFIPILVDWNSSVKTGKTTQKASLLCLKYYRLNESQYSYSRDGKLITSVIKTIAYGASEINQELSELIDYICERKQEGKTRYFDNFAKLVLKDNDGLYIAKAMPDKVLKLANVYWLKDYISTETYMSNHKEREHVFGVADEFDFNYHPESAYQTPIFNWLRFDLKGTIDFVLALTNKVTDNYVRHFSNVKFETHTVDIDGKDIEIILDNRLWCAYRGANGSPSLIQSILMAVEKFFLEVPEDTKAETLSYWLKYLLKNTNSSLICGLVASIVLAFKDKLFNIATYLFESSAFIEFDTARRVFDSQHKGQLETVRAMVGGISRNKLHEQERMDSCDLPHRKESLETLCLYYQVFARAGEVEEPEVEERQNQIWSILDKHYKKLDDESDSEQTKVWRMALARMDRRKMKITSEEVDGNIALNFEPELTPDLIEMSENHQEKQKQDFKYAALSIWANSKVRGTDDCFKYDQYESSPENVISDLRNLIKALTGDQQPGEDFLLFNRATHVYASVALLMHYFDELHPDDLSLCLEIFEDWCKNLVDEKYHYQVGDGMDACFTAIPSLFKALPEERPSLKLILILGLMRSDSIQIMGTQRFSDFAIAAITLLWDEYELDIKDIYWGYLLLNPLYYELVGTIRQECFERNNFERPEFEELWSRLFEENANILAALENGTISKDFIIDYDSLDIHTKSVGVCLLSNSLKEWEREQFLKLSEVSTNSLLSDDDERGNNYESINNFLKKTTALILSSEIDDISTLLAPYVKDFQSSEGSADLLEEFVLTQDSLVAYEQFWEVWELFKPKVVELAERGHFHYRFDNVVKNYLCAIQWWKPDTVSWHTLKERDARFFGEMADKLSKAPTTLYSISKLLNDIGSSYIKHGVYWLAQIIESNSKLSSKDLDDDTVYYINKYMRKYLYRERANVRRSPELMAKSITVLDFLIEKGEVSGYLLRESIV